MRHKGKLKRIAKIHAASVIRNTECKNAFETSELSNEELEYLDQQMVKISDKLLGNDLPMSNSEEIVKSILN